MKINFVQAKHILEFEEDIKALFACAREYLGLDDRVEVNIVEVSKKDIRTLNRKFRNTDRVTDVLSFPMLASDGLIKCDTIYTDHAEDIDYETNLVMLGDTYLCFRQAKKQAKEYGHSVKREVCYLLLHSLLHLLGYDHIEESDRAKMRKVEEEVLSRCDITRGEV